MAKGRWYSSWANMIARCYDENSPSYPNYGGRGITVCKRWRDNSQSFFEDMGERPEGMSLERINNDKGYSLKNCKWATIEEQKRNTRVRKDSLTGFKGIQFDRGYRAYINIKGKRIQLGRYKTLEEAIEIRKKAEEEFWI